MGKPITAEKLRELAEKSGFTLVKTGEANPAADGGADDIPVRSADDIPVRDGGNDDPPPAITLSADDDQHFGAVLKLHKAGYMSHSDWRAWELWRERNGK